jgi:glutamine amidotransferase PdxT
MQVIILVVLAADKAQEVSSLVVRGGEGTGVQEVLK